MCNQSNQATQPRATWSLQFLTIFFTRNPWVEEKRWCSSKQTSYIYNKCSSHLNHLCVTLYNAIWMTGNDFFNMYKALFTINHHDSFHIYGEGCKLQLGKKSNKLMKVKTKNFFYKVLPVNQQLWVSSSLSLPLFDLESPCSFPCSFPDKWKCKQWEWIIYVSWFQFILSQQIYYVKHVKIT